MECSVGGEPNPTCKWFKDGKEITEADGYKFVELEDGTRRLEIASVEVAKAGVFRCEATNEAGTSSTEAELSVEGWLLATVIYRMFLRSVCQRKFEIKSKMIKKKLIIRKICLKISSNISVEKYGSLVFRGAVGKTVGCTE